MRRYLFLQLVVDELISKKDIIIYGPTFGKGRLLMANKIVQMIFDMIGKKFIDNIA